MDTTSTLPLATLETAWSAPRFFAAIFAGFVIAVAIQLLLTTLSVALGATAAGTSSESDSDSDESGDTGVGATIRRVNHAFGVWATISGSLALFVGCWLGVELSLTVDAAAGAVIGLTIWSLFYLAMMSIETTLVGRLLRTASSGLAGTLRGISSAVSSSESKQAADTAAEVAAAVRDELLEDRRVRDIGKAIRSTVDRLESDFDPASLRGELETLLGRTEIEATVGDTGFTEQGETGVTASIKTRPGPSKTSVKRMQRAASEARDIVKDEVDSDKRPADSAVTAGMRLLGVSEAKAAEYRSQFEGYLRRADSDVLDPEGLKRDLEGLFDDPQSAWETLKDRFSRANRNTLKGLLTARGVSEDKAEKVTGWAEKALQQMRNAPDRTPLKQRATQGLRRFLAQVDDPALRYDDLKDELELLLDDPRAGSDALIRRLKSLDRDTLKSILATREDTTEEDADELLRAIEDARDSVLARAEKAKIEIDTRLQQIKQASADAAEEARRTVSTAAWWSFGAAAISGAAAAAGGMLAITHGIG